VVRYGATVALASLAVLVRKRLPLGPDVAVGIYPLPIAAVLASAWYFGRGAALVAILASTFGLAYAYVPPLDSSGIVWQRVFGLLLFVVVAGFAGQFAAARRIAEEALTESEARFRLTAENLPEVLWIEALEPRRILYVSPSYERIWGHAASELYRDAHRWLEAIHPDDRASVSASFMRWLAGSDGRPYDVEYRIVRPDGTIRWIHDRGALIRDQRGRPYRASGVAEDITERKQMEDRLRASEQMWRAAFENSPTMFFLMDAAGKVLSVNAFGAEQLGYAVDELVGRPVLDVFREADREAVQRNFSECIDRAGQTMRWEFRKVRKNGDVAWFRDFARAVRGPKGDVTVLVACEDVTAAKLEEEALAQSRAELAHVTRVTTMGELTASIAHEVNQPLTAIVTHANASLRWLARQPPDIDEARQAIASVVREGIRAGDMIARVRAMARKSAVRSGSSST
jgi:PAS domain S-box-containing protein